MRTWAAWRMVGGVDLLLVLPIGMKLIQTVTWQSWVKMKVRSGL